MIRVLGKSKDYRVSLLNRRHAGILLIIVIDRGEINFKVGLINLLLRTLSSFNVGYCYLIPGTNGEHYDRNGLNVEARLSGILSPHFGELIYITQFRYTYLNIYCFLSPFDGIVCIFFTNETNN